MRSIDELIGPLRPLQGARVLVFAPNLRAADSIASWLDAHGAHLRMRTAHADPARGTACFDPHLVLAIDGSSHEELAAAQRHPRLRWASAAAVGRGPGGFDRRELMTMLCRALIADATVRQALVRLPDTGGELSVAETGVCRALRVALASDELFVLRSANRPRTPHLIAGRGRLWRNPRGRETGRVDLAGLVRRVVAWRTSRIPDAWVPTSLNALFRCDCASEGCAGRRDETPALLCGT